MKKDRRLNNLPNKWNLITLPIEEKNRCFYCGEKAFVYDHVPPVSFFDFIDYGLLIPSCNECNSHLNKHLQETLGERIENIKEYLQKKYKKILLFPDWTEEELNNMGEHIRNDIKRNIILKEDIKKRILYYSVFYQIYKDFKLFF